jgi:hypothetical protein
MQQFLDVFDWHVALVLGRSPFDLVDHKDIDQGTALFQLQAEAFNGLEGRNANWFALLQTSGSRRVRRLSSVLSSWRTRAFPTFCSC